MSVTTISLLFDVVTLYICRFGSLINFAAIQLPLWKTVILQRADAYSGLDRFLNVSRYTLLCDFTKTSVSPEKQQFDKDVTLSLIKKLLSPHFILCSQHHFAKSSSTNLPSFRSNAYVNPLCSRAFATHAQFSYELLYISIESRLYHHPLGCLALPPPIACGVLYFHFDFDSRCTFPCR